jgi:hypothetical protein
LALWDFDHQIVNDGSLEDLEAKVLALLERVPPCLMT